MLWPLLAVPLLAVQVQATGTDDRGMAEAAILAARAPADTASGTDRSMVEAAILAARDPVDATSGTDRSMAEAALLAAREPVDTDLARVVFVQRAADANAKGSALANITGGGMSTIGSGVTLNADGTINMTAWDETVTAACNAALAKLPESSNPSGTCTCYNLPALNNATGTFEADLRLFQISTPRDAFSGIAPENVQVGLSYTGASVSPVSMDPVQPAAAKLAGSQDTTTSANASSSADGSGGLRMLQHYLFVGQINKELLTPNMDMGQLEALVMPLVTLTGTGTDGAKVSTNVSSNEAAFVAGVFSDTVVMSNTTKAQVAVSEVVAALANHTVAFVLPGVQIILFPIGLIITSIWLAIGCLVIGMGFVQRVSFRESYRARALQSVKGGMGTI